MTARATADSGVVTLEEFLVLPDEEGYRLELDRGRVAREPAPGPRHSRVAFRVVDLLRRAGEENGLGFVLFETGFRLSTVPNTLRVPDVAFVRREEVPEGGWGDRFLDGAPDLAVEVVSPSNTASEMQRKALDYLEGGARLVWIVDPDSRTVTAFRSRSEIRILGEEDALDGGDVLPGLSARVGELFLG